MPSNIHIETFCPKCKARLHTANFAVIDLDNEDEFVLLDIDCWQCTWTTQFQVKHHAAQADES